MLLQIQLKLIQLKKTLLKKCNLTSFSKTKSAAGFRERFLFIYTVCPMKQFGHLLLNVIYKTHEIFRLEGP